MPKEERPKIEEVAGQESWEDADIVYEFKDGAYVIGQVEILGLGYLVKFEMTSEEEDRFLKLIHRIFALNQFKLEKEQINKEKIRTLNRKIRIIFSPEQPTYYDEDHQKQMLVTGKHVMSGKTLTPDPFIIGLRGLEDPVEGFDENWHGKIIVYPNNISDKIQLYVTVFHELTHIIQKWQGKSFLLDVPVWAKYGEEPCEIEAENAGEKAAEILMGLRQYKEYKRRQKEAGKGPRDFS